MTAGLIDPPIGIEVGVFRSMPLAAYHALRVASNSRLARLKQSPAHLLAYLATPQEDTKATLLGNAVHCAVLEPDDFDARYTIAGQCTAKTERGGQCRNTGTRYHADLGWVCGIAAHAQGFLDFDTARTVLSADDHAIAIGARDGVYRLRTAKQLLSGDGENELTAIFPAFDTDVLAKARFDRISPVLADGVIVDLKTTRDASRREFERAIYSYGYHRQAALYLDGAAACQLPAKHFVHIAIEKEPPFAVGVYRLTEGAIDAGEQELLPLLARYAECMASGEFPAYPDEVQDIALPAYAWGQIDEYTREVMA
jgi:hypothetical protein